MAHFLFGILAAFAFVGQFSHAENGSPSQAIMPAGTIPKGSTVTLQQVNAGDTFYDLSQRKNSGNELFQQVNSEALYNVQKLQSGLADAELANVQALISQQQLMIQQNDFKNSMSNCVPSFPAMTCTAANNIPVFMPTTFNFADQYASIMDLPYTPSSTYSSEPYAQYQALDKKIAEVNKKNAGPKSLAPNCPDKVPDELKSNPTLYCGVQQAIKALTKAQSEGEISIKNNVFIFNDFSSGGVTGKMWFLNSDGSPANIMKKNPILVSRGKNGFGSRDTSFKTPDGALKSLPYKYPLDGNIKEAIRLAGLEPQNKNTFGRGIFIHGWDPLTETNGCLGIPGSYESKSAGKRQYGGTPQYYDELKKGLLGNGSVLVYNFTPKKKDSCKK